MSSSPRAGAPAAAGGPPARPDRAAAVRRALRETVAERGFHGASMGAVAQAARVATGTAYTHYASKDELVLAAYTETKARLSGAAVEGLGDDVAPAQRFREIWLSCHRHLRAHPEEAMFLLQVDSSPYAAAAHAAASGPSDPLLEQMSLPEVAALLLPLPPAVLYELGLAPAVRLAASGPRLTDEQLRLAAQACWRAVSKPPADGVSPRAGAGS